MRWSVRERLSDCTPPFLERTYRLHIVHHSFLDCTFVSNDPSFLVFCGAERRPSNMSGPHLVEQTAEAIPNLPSSSAQDPAASLRAAALLTLKSKKRKATATPAAPHIPRPFAAPPSIELDYGSEEPSGATTSKDPEAAAQPPKTVAAAPEAMAVDDSQGREEGEISDEELSMGVSERETYSTRPRPAPSGSQPTLLLRASSLLWRYI